MHVFLVKLDVDCIVVLLNNMSTMDKVALWFYVTNYIPVTTWNDYSQTNCNESDDLRILFVLRFLWSFFIKSTNADDPRKMFWLLKHFKSNTIRVSEKDSPQKRKKKMEIAYREIVEKDIEPCDDELFQYGFKCERRCI